MQILYLNYTFRVGLRRVFQVTDKTNHELFSGGVRLLLFYSGYRSTTLLVKLRALAWKELLYVEASLSQLR